MPAKAKNPLDQSMDSLASATNKDEVYAALQALSDALKTATQAEILRVFSVSLRRLELEVLDLLEEKSAEKKDQLPAAFLPLLNLLPDLHGEEYGTYRGPSEPMFGTLYPVLSGLDKCMSPKSMEAIYNMVLSYLEENPRLYNSGIRCFNRIVESHLLHLFVTNFPVFDDDSWKITHLYWLYSSLANSYYDESSLPLLYFSEQCGHILCAIPRFILEVEDEEEVLRQITTFLKGAPYLSEPMIKKAMGYLKKEIPQKIFAWAEKANIPLTDCDKAIFAHAQEIANGEPLRKEIAESSRTNRSDLAITTLHALQHASTSLFEKDLAPQWALYLFNQATCPALQEKLADHAAFELNIRVLNQIQRDAWFPPVLDRLVRFYLALNLCDIQFLPEAVEWVSAERVTRERPIEE